MCNAGTHRTLYLPCLSHTLPALSVHLNHSCVSLSVAPVNHLTGGQSLPFQIHVTLDPVSCIPLVSPFVLLSFGAPCLLHHTCCGVVHHVCCTTHAPARAWYGRVGGACYGSLLQLLSCCISQDWWCMLWQHTYMLVVHGMAPTCHLASNAVTGMWEWSDMYAVTCML